MVNNMSDIKEQIKKAIQAHRKVLDEIQAEDISTIAAAAKLITDTLKRNGRIYICGNGGSAADAQHIAAELVVRFSRQRKALPAIALTTNTSLITAVCNDYDFEKVFSRQVEALVTNADVLWAISTSGGSKNIIAAVRSARKKGAAILAFTGIRDSELQKQADICFCCGSKSTAISQEIHQLAYHIICDLVEQYFSSEQND